MFLSPFAYKFAMLNYRLLNTAVGSFGVAALTRSFIIDNPNRATIAFQGGAVLVCVATIMFWAVKAKK